MQYKIFGCKVNKYYTDKWLNSDYLKNKQGVFVASCVVTDNAKRKWIKFIKDLFKNEEVKDDESVFVSGCGAFKDGRAQDDFFDLYPELSEYKSRIEILGEDPDEKKLDGKKQINFDKLKLITKGLYTKKFILIQGGCDSFCSFCLTVKKRGRHYFRAKEDISEEIEDFVKSGGKEVVLTGINLSAWGLDSTNPKLGRPVGKIEEVKSNFAELLEYLLKNTKIRRLRISSLGPEFVDKKVLEIFKNKRIYPHFHFSVQSGSTRVLGNMMRHYTGEFLKDILVSLRNIKREDNINISIGADIIVGFPGETEQNFKETLDLVSECKITKVHAFPFSGHKLGENVPAGFYEEQISEKIKKERMNRILELADKVREEFIKENVGNTFEVLVEQVDENGNWKGWTQNYIEANNENIEVISGEIKRNEIIVGKLKRAFSSF